jgi:hypothetical protein
LPRSSPPAEELASPPRTPPSSRRNGVVAIGFARPFSPLAHTFGFTDLPLGLVGVIAAIIPTYLLTLKLGKRVFYRHQQRSGPRSAHDQHVARRLDDDLGADRAEEQAFDQSAVAGADRDEVGAVARGVQDGGGWVTDLLDRRGFDSAAAQGSAKPA